MSLRRSKATKRQKAPEINAEKMQRVKDCASTLSRDFCPPGGNMAIVIDDESYFTLKGDEER